MTCKYGILHNININRRTDKRAGLVRKQNDVQMVPFAKYLFTMFCKPSFNTLQVITGS